MFRWHSEIVASAHEMSPVGPVDNCRALNLVQISGRNPYMGVRSLYIDAMSRFTRSSTERNGSLHNTVR